MLGLSVGTSGALTLLTPIAARAHVGVLIALRIAIGMAEVRNPTFRYYLCYKFFVSFMH